MSDSRCVEVVSSIELLFSDTHHLMIQCSTDLSCMFISVRFQVSNVFSNLAETNTCWRCQNETGIHIYLSMFQCDVECYVFALFVSSYHCKDNLPSAPHPPSSVIVSLISGHVNLSFISTQCICMLLSFHIKMP